MGCSGKNANFFNSDCNRRFHQHGGKGVEGPHTSTGPAGLRRQPTHSPYGTGDTTFGNNEADQVRYGLRDGDTKPNAYAFGDVLHGDAVRAFAGI